jgi:hypothetical protein
MSLSVAKAALEADIAKAFQSRKDNGEDNATLAKDLAKAIHTYATQADVDISLVLSTTPPGQIVAVAGTPSAQVGATTSPGIATHTGFGGLK